MNGWRVHQLSMINVWLWVYCARLEKFPESRIVRAGPIPAGLQFARMAFARTSLLNTMDVGPRFLSRDNLCARQKNRSRPNTSFKAHSGQLLILRAFPGEGAHALKAVPPGNSVALVQG
jgi:hypothetical protein